MSLRDDIDRVKAARGYVREHFLIDEQTHVGQMKSADFDAAIDRIVAFADETLTALLRRHGGDLSARASDEQERVE